MVEKIKFDTYNWTIGVVVLFLAFFSVFQAYQNHDADTKQQTCIADIVKKQNQALKARSQIANRSDAVTSDFLLSVPKLKTQKEFKTALNKYVEGEQQIKADRKAHPYPPYPEGKCD